MGKFLQIFTKLSARNMIMAGYYSLTFLFKLNMHLKIKLIMKMYIYCSPTCKYEENLFICVYSTAKSKHHSEHGFHYI